jgi:hypothetical protein
MFGEVGEAGDDTALVVSELVSNCVRADAHNFELALEGHHGTLRIEATDDAPGMPTPVQARPDEPSGRGLMIIERLSTEWGVRPEPPGKTVWAELSLGVDVRALFDCSRIPSPNPRLRADLGDEAAS